MASRIWSSIVFFLLLAWRLPVVRSENAEKDSRMAFARHLQSCDTILANWSVDELRSGLNVAIDETVGADSTEAAIARLTLLNATTFGVQVRLLCASCSEVSSETLPSEFSDFCTGYGADESFSGLLLSPLEEDGSFVKGTRPGAIWCHGTSTQDVPSTQFNGLESGLELLINAAVASTGAIALMPDYMGYGQTSGRIFKAYLVKKQYQTSIIPLWLKAGQVLQQESNCTAALADAAAVLGYSEGGYAAVALADGLYRIGVDIIRVEAGAGPYRMGSAALLDGQKLVDEGLYPLENRHYFALVGAAYSSTYPELANFDVGQDMLASDVRQTIVDLVTDSASAEEIRELVPVDDATSVFNPQLLAFARNAIRDEVRDPCNDADWVVEGENDMICQALQDNDLTGILESTPYPVQLCHSPNDTIVSYGNLPDFGGNTLLELLDSTGDHVEAASTCLLRSVLFLLSDDFLEAQVADKTTDAACVVLSMADSSSPSTLPTEAESLSPTLSKNPSLSPAPTITVEPTISPTEGNVCGEVLASWSADESRRFVTEVYAGLYGKDSQEYALLELFADQAFRFGVEVRKVCAVCDEFDVASSSYEGYCGQGVYGSSATHSGLLMVPLSSNGTDIAEGTFPGFVYNRDGMVDRAPSDYWSIDDGPLATVAVCGVLPATSGSIAILPDYLGYGESNGAIYKAFYAKKGYQTSIIPLWLKTAAILANETKCTALADAAMVSGFSEGGYSSVVVADALDKLGVDIIRVHAGAVAARLGSIHLPTMVESIDDGRFPLMERSLLALLGSSYSATYTGMANFEEGPYLLSATVRDEIVTLVTQVANTDMVNQAVPVNDPLSIWEENVVSWARDAIAQNETDPCSMNFTELEFTPFCDTLLENDLIDLLENANFSITLCHGLKDSVVSITNLPDDSANANLLISLVDGDHAESFVQCTSQLVTFLSSPTYMSYPIVPKHNESVCAVSTTGSPTIAPTEQTTASPVAVSLITTDTSANEQATAAIMSVFCCIVSTAIVFL